jgi:hypothetical protein
VWSNLSITVDVVGGADIDDAIRDAVALANRLGVGVVIAPNGIKMNVNPGDDPDDLIRDWESEVASQLP